jgi:hypothetical protein
LTTEEESPPRLIEATSNPWSAAHLMPAAMLSYEPEPQPFSTLPAQRFASVETPTTSSLLFIASALPAQWVPWSLSSSHA